MHITRSRLLAVLATACPLLCATAAQASSTPSQMKAAVQKGAAYLQSQQTSEGSFTGFGGEWTLSALAAAGVAPAGVKHGEGGVDARSFYRSLIGDTATWPGGSEPPVTDFETAALAAYAAGIDPARVSPTQNLIAQIFARYQPGDPGTYGGGEFFNGTAFALLALADAKTRQGKQRVPQMLLEKSIEAVRRNQHDDGGWSFLAAEGNAKALAAPGEAEFTGATIAALCGAGVPASNATIAGALKFLKTELDAEPLGSGGFESEFGVNTDTAAWAVEGLDACGVDPQSAEFTTSHGHTPVDFLISQQLSGGGFQFEPEEGLANLYSSQDGVRALAGGGFTATPPKAKGQPKWVYEKKFTPSVGAELALVVDNGSSPLSVCAVPVAPESAKTTLAKVLEAAQSSATPSGCVGSFTPASGSGAITSLGGLPSPPSASWQVSLDGGTEKLAKRSTPIPIGNTIYLRLG